MAATIIVYVLSKGSFPLMSAMLAAHAGGAPKRSTLFTVAAGCWEAANNSYTNFCAALPSPLFSSPNRVYMRDIAVSSKLIAPCYAPKGYACPVEATLAAGCDGPGPEAATWEPATL